MAPPPALQSSSPAVHPVIREVTEDTPPDLLEGTMDLVVVLPSTKSVRMTVNRRTPMMDLLIQVATINKINPGDHIVQVRNERGIELPYKPSTPIGALDTTTIEIVPKNRVNEYIIVKKPAKLKLANQPFEQTFRLQVHLPRNQLYVMRVSPRTVLEDILKEVCQEKNLDLQKYEIRHPANLDEKLPLTHSLSDFGLTEVTVVSRNTKINSSVSSADIISAMQQTEEGRTKYMDSSFKHSRSSVGDSSVSSGSTGSARGVSPSRSDDSRSISPLPHTHSKSKLNHRTSTLSSCSSGILPSVQKSLSNMNSLSGKTSSLPAGIQAPPRTKKRAAPPPPTLLVKSHTESMLSTSSISAAVEINSQSPAKPTPRKKAAPRLPPKANTFDTSDILPNHSRHSSGSSGYHESSILSDQNEAHRFDRQISAPAMLSKQGTARSTSNLTTVSSLSSTSLASSTGGSKKRRAPPPPAAISFKPQSEIEEEDSEASSSINYGLHSSKSDRSRQSSVEVEVDVHHTPVGRTSSGNHSRNEAMLSSSPSSSQSSPESSSGSNSSSPLPSIESPSSSMNKASQPSSNNNVPSISPTGNRFSSVEDGRSSPANSGSAQAAAPLPPPRTKTRDTMLTPSSDEPNSQPEPKPRPKPRPRPDRVSVDNLIADNPVVIKPKPKPIEPAKPEPSPVSSSQLRNPLAKYGVKVLPDNVIKERADRLAKKASEDLVQSDDDLINEPPKKAAAPPPPTDTTSRGNPIKPEFQKKVSDSSLSSGSNSKQISNFSQSDQSGKESVRSSKSLNQKLGVENSKVPKERSSQELSTEYESDDLEENLELFEPSPVLRKISSDSRLVDKHSAAVNISLKSPDSSFDQPKSSTSSQDSREIIEQPVPKPKVKSIVVANKERDGGPRKSRIISASVSGLEDIEKDEKIGSSSGGISELDPGGFSRTHSDRLKSSRGGLKSSGESKSSDDKQLNRWQNLVSLNEIDDQSEPNASSKNATKTITNKIPARNPLNKTNSAKSPHLFNKNKSGRTSSEDFHKDDHILTANEDHDEDVINSSESDVSYTDSGIPATEPVTPSPMDFDSRISEHEDDGRRSSENFAHDKEIMSNGSSPRSSFHSSDGDQWRNVMEAKTLQTHEEREKTFASMIPESNTKASITDEEFDQKNKNSVSEKRDISEKDDQNVSNSDSGADDGDGHISTSEGELIDDEPKDINRTSDIVPIRKLSKSESFSHNSEFDIVEMKRKKFASGPGRKGDSKRGSSTADLRSSSNHSSSEEDLRSTKPQERNQKNHSLGTSSDNVDKIKGNKATSMHNLTSNNNRGQINMKSQQELEANKDSRGDGFITVQKATSLMEIQKLDSDNSNNPDIMKQFHTQLEAQFEQWKQDFLKKHLTEGQVPEKDDQPTMSDFQVERNTSILTYRETPHTQNYSSLDKRPVTPEPKKESEDTTKYLQYNHQSAQSSPLRSTSPTPLKLEKEVHSKTSDDYDEEPVETVPIVKTSVAAIPSQVSESGKETHKEPEMQTQHKLQKSATQPAYRYSGPPTINMSSWSDRKRTATVTVKKDQDYIMGFGQFDTKSASTESKSFVGSKGPSTPSNQSVSSPEQPAVIKSTPPVVDKSPSPVIATPVRGLSASLNVRPRSTNSENSEGTGNVKSVLSSWKQRVEQSEKERNVNPGPPPEIDIYGTEPLPVKRSSYYENPNVIFETSKPKQSEFRTELNSSDSTTNGSIKSIENDESNKTTPTPSVQKTNVYNQDGLKRTDSLTIKQSNSQPVIVEVEKSNSIKSKTSKPMLFKMSTMESKPVTRIQSFAESKEVDVVDGNMDKSPADDQNGPTLQERKKFFQGVKPVLNGKEAPVPAENFKSSIATIQNLFEHRQQNGHPPSVQRSMTLPSQSSNKETNSITITQPDTSSSTIPKNFQVMSSNEMVQRVLGRPSGYNYETFRRSPSPVSSTTSTLSRTSSSGRGTPSSTSTFADVPDNNVRISTEYKKSAPPPPSTIQNVGNKAIIIVNGSDRGMNDAEMNPTNSVSNNIFKQQMKVNASTNPSLKHTASLNISNRPKENKIHESNATKIIVNSTPMVKLSQPVIEIREAPVTAKPIVVDQTVKESSKRSSIASTKEVVPKRDSIDASRLKSINNSSNNNSPPPPPPPPPSEGLNLRPTGLNLNGKSKSVTSVTNSQASTPASPSSPDPRAEICNLIKNSNGNFGLKKTGSTFLLK